MAVTITGSKDSGTLTSTGTTTVTDSTAPFTASDYYAQRIVGLWTSGGTYKGMAYVLTCTSTSVLTLETPFFDYTGATVTQTSGDIYLSSLNFADVSGSGYSLVSNLVTSPQLIFGNTTNTSRSVCFYDEFKEVYINSTSGGPPAISLVGGLIVFGHLLDYASGAVTGDVAINSTAAPASGTVGQVFEFSNSSSLMKFAMFGGSMIAGGTGGSGHVGPGDSGYAAEWCKLWSTTVSSDLASPGGGAVWSSNPSRQEVRDIRSYCSGQYAINLRWADGIILGGSYLATAGSQSAANLPLSIFGSDAAGTFTIAAPYPKRLQAIAQPRSCLWRSNTTPTQTINYTNVLADFHGTLTGTGPGAQTNATQNFYFTGVFSTLAENTIATIKADADSALEDSDTVDSTGITDEITILRETQVANGTPTVRGPWTTAFFSYLHDILSFAVATSYTVVGQNSVEDVVFGGPLAQATDENITETTKATVDAYTTISDLSRLYDRAKSYKCTLANVLYPAYTTPLISANGTILDLGGQNLTIDDSAGSAFAVTTGSSLITIDAGTALAPSAKFNTITTTGTVDLTDTTAIDSLTFDCDLNLAEIVDLDTVTVTGTLDFATAGTYEFTDCIIGEVTNSSGGSVTINAYNSTITTNTGPNITINNLVGVTVTLKNQSGVAMPGVEVAIFQDNSARTVILASTATDENGEVSTTANASLGAIIIRARQSAQTATFNTTTGVNESTEIITTDSTHNFRDGDAVTYYVSAGGSDDIGLTDATTYYINTITASTLSLHTTATNAIADTSRVNLTEGTEGETHLLDPVRYVATSATGSIGTGDFNTQITMVTDTIVSG